MKEPIVFSGSTGGLNQMNWNLGRKAGAGLLIALMNINVVQIAWSKSLPGKGIGGYPQLQQDVEQIDGFGTKFNSDASNKDRVANLLTSFEKILNRPLDNAERKFLTLEFATIDRLPRFEVKEKTIQIFDTEDGSKDLLLSIEIVDLEKSIFKFGQRTFQLDPSKPIHENVQLILKELQKGDAVSFWQSLNPFAIPQAQAEMAGWLKVLLIAGVALAVGVFVGMAIQKNKAKKEAAQLAGSQENGSSNKESASHTSEEPKAAETEAIPAISEAEPAVV